MIKILETLALQKMTKRAYKYILINVSILQILVRNCIRKGTEYDTNTRQEMHCKLLKDITTLSKPGAG